MSLPMNLNELTQALQQTQKFARDNATSYIYVKMGKDGIWTYGTEELRVEDEATWAVNPTSWMTGFSAFDDNHSRVGEEMRNMSEPPILPADLPPVNGKWEAQLGFSVKCLNGEDEGLEGVIYQRSRGGREELTKLLTQTLDRSQAGDDNVVAIIRLKSASYKHKQYGKIYTPVLEIIDWVSMDDLEEGEGKKAPASKALPAPEEEKAPVKRRRRARA